MLPQHIATLTLVIFAVAFLPLSNAAEEVQPVWWNGMNVPWRYFGYDIGTSTGFDTNWFRSFFRQMRNKRVNSVRFWVHCDGRGSPLFNNDGSVSGLSSTFISDIKKLARLARNHKMVLMLTLWSFDMFKEIVPGGLHPDLVTQQWKTQTYINRALIPMVQALNEFDNIVYEIMNEPEWGIQGPGNTKVTVPRRDMQRFHAMIAQAIHQHSAAKVTTGSASLKWNSDTVGPAEGNYWSDAALRSAYWSQEGVLDFYQIHYYDWMYNPTWGFDPCRKPASYWQLDKPTIVGEIASSGGNHYNANDFMYCVEYNNFAGVMFWAYNDPTSSNYNWNHAANPLDWFAGNHPHTTAYSTLKSWLANL